MKIQKSTTEKELVKALKKGSKDAMGELYLRYFDKVYAKCLSFIKNTEEAYDCANEIILISFEKIQSFKEESQFGTWLFVITKNYCLMHLKKLNKELKTNFLECHNFPDVTSDSAELNKTEEKLEFLNKLINELPEIDRKLIILKYFYMASIKDLMVIFGLSKSAVKMRLMRIRKKLLHLFQLKLSKTKESDFFKFQI